MKYAFALGLISILLAAMAFLYPGTGTVLLAWAALGFAVVASGYAGAGKRVFGKRRDGSIPWLVKILLFPYLAFTWVVWHLYRLLSREPAFNRIGDDLVIGRRLLAGEVGRDYDHYIDLTSELEDPRDLRIRPGYKCLPILDASVPAREELGALVLAAGKGSTYIHCAQGHGRTGLIALALLFHRGQVNSAEEGIALLKSLRPAIRLNRTQQRFIEDYLREEARAI